MENGVEMQAYGDISGSEITCWLLAGKEAKEKKMETSTGLGIIYIYIYTYMGCYRDPLLHSASEHWRAQLTRSNIWGGFEIIN